MGSSDSSYKYCTFRKWHIQAIIYKKRGEMTCTQAVGANLLIASLKKNKKNVGVSSLSFQGQGTRTSSCATFGENSIWDRADKWDWKGRLGSCRRVPLLPADLDIHFNGTLNTYSEVRLGDSRGSLPHRHTTASSEMVAFVCIKNALRMSVQQSHHSPVSIEGSRQQSSL